MKKQILFPTLGNLFTTNKGVRSQAIHSLSTFLLFGIFVLSGVQGALGQEFRSVSTQKQSGTTLTVSKPINLVIGDLLIAQISQSSDNNADLVNATSSGWSVVTSRQYRSNGTDRWHVTILSKIATSTDVAASSFSFSGNVNTDNIMGGIMAISDACIVSTIGQWSTTDNDNSYNAPSISINTTRSLVVMFGAVANNKLTTDNSWTFGNQSMMERYDVDYDATKDMGISAATIHLNSTGSGAGTASITGSDPNVSILLSISGRPTVSFPQSPLSVCSGSSLNITSTVSLNNPISNTIAFNGFESGNTWGYVNTNGSLKAGTSGSGDRPSSASFVSSGSSSFWVNNGTAILTTSNITGLSSYTNKVMTFNLAAFSVNSGSNGMDQTDNVTIEISLDNGTTYSSEIVISGNNNACWGFSSGTGNAAITYDGNNSPSTFAPSGGGLRTSDGFSTISINLPNSSQQVVLRITLKNSDSNEGWLIDNLALTGTPNTTYAWSSSPTGFTSAVQNPTGLNPSVNTTYTLTATNAFGCAATANIAVTVNNVTTTSTLATDDYVWNGKVSNDFNAASNWIMQSGSTLVAAQTAPLNSTNVFIPNVTQACVFNTPNILNNTASVKNLTIEAGGALSMGSGSLDIHGNYSNSGLFTPGTGLVTFSAQTGNQTISKSGGETFAKLKINKAAGNVILANNVTVSTELSLVKGLLVLGSNDLILGGANLIDHSSQSYIKTSSTGKIKRNVGSTGSVFFPVGNSSYNPVELTNTLGTDVFSVSVIDSVYINGTSGALQTSSVVNRTWLIEEASAGNNSVKMKLYWNGAGEQLTSFNPTNAFVAHYVSSSSMWDNLGGAVYSNYVESSQAVSSFSPFTISSSPAFAPLPVELMSLDAQCAGENVIVAWKTASEHNSLNYVVERSEDGTAWNEIQTVAAAGNSNTVLDYAIEDAGAARGLKYYRLIQKDQDGKQKIYGPVMSNCGSDDNSFISFPNPGDGELTLVFNGNNFNGTSILNVRDANGRMVRTIALDIQPGTTSVLIPDMELTPGVYYLQLEGDNYTSKVIKHSLR